MRLRRSIFAAAVLFLAARPAPTSAQVPAEWATDVRALLAAMDSIHPAPYRIHSRAEWERLAAEIEARVPTLRYHQFIAELARLVALAADGHTRFGNIRIADHQRVVIDPGPGEGFDSFYPMLFQVFADGLYAVRAHGSHRGLFGKKILTINGLPTAQVFERFRPLIPADNEAWQLLLFPDLMRLPGYVAGVGLVTSPSEPLRLTVAEPDGRTSEHAVEPGLPPGDWLDADRTLRPNIERPLWRRLEGRYAFTHLAEHRTVYVRYREVQNVEGEPIAAFAKRLFRFVDSSKAERLVFDLRGNGGGNNYLNQPLIHGMIRAVRVNQPGKLFVITDRGTFSAAMNFVGEAERNTHALFVGEPTAAPVNHYGDSRRVTLPASGIQVRISSLYWQFSDPRDTRRWVVPDLPVPTRFEDWVSGRDPVLEAVLAYRHDESAPVRAPNTNWGRPSQKKDLGPLVRW